MEATEIRKIAALEDKHWWYKERRVLLDRELTRLGDPGRALDIGAAGGGNTRVMRSRGWSPLAIEYSAAGAEVARERGLDVMRADARCLPVRSGSFDLVTAFDVLEHIDEDYVAVGEMFRALRPGGTLLVSVPCDMALWSAHDVALSHMRRYSRETLTGIVEKAGFEIESLSSWNVLLRPVAEWRRRRSTDSDMDYVSPVVNAGLTAIVTVERYLPVKSLRGVSLMLRARRP
jgi:SAM-dependent methyltransferase